jgi:hypothetical protein
VSARSEEVATSAASSQCSEPDCTEPRWTVTRRGELVVVSAYCFDHANVPIFGVPKQPKPKRPKHKPRLRTGGGELLSDFHSDVRRQRLAREP